MDKKLEQLTKKLYEEGLSKGRSDADELVANAKKEAQAIIKEANAKAQSILESAQKSADDLKKNTNTEIVLASRQMIAALKQQIEKLVIAKNITPAVGQTVKDTAFIKEVILALVKNWNSSEKTDLNVMLPAETADAFAKEVKKAVGDALGSESGIILDKGVKSGFKVGPKDGSYYISFTDADFDALFKEYLRPKVAELLFSEQK